MGLLTKIKRLFTKDEQVVVKEETIEEPIPVPEEEEAIEEPIPVPEEEPIVLSDDEIYLQIKEQIKKSFETKQGFEIEQKMPRSVAKRLMIDFPFLNFQLDSDLRLALEKEIKEESKLSEVEQTLNQVRNLISVLDIKKTETKPEQRKPVREITSYNFDFVSIDFETANENKHSACSLAVVGFKDGVEVVSKHWYLRPEPFYVNYHNERVHGLSEDFLGIKPIFNMIWDELKPFIENQHLVAHNMGFDNSILLGTLSFFEIEVPPYTTSCTYQLAKKKWKLEDYKLPRVAKYAGLKDFVHHDALSDAKACGHIYSELLKDEVLGKTIHKVAVPDQYVKAPVRKKVAAPAPAPKVTNTPKNPSKLEGLRFASTGELNSFTREQFKEIVTEYGGKFTTTVSSLTDYLVVGYREGLSLKEIKAIEFSVKIIDEQQFIAMLN